MVYGPVEDYKIAIKGGGGRGAPILLIYGPINSVSVAESALIILSLVSPRRMVEVEVERWLMNNQL